MKITVEKLERGLVLRTPVNTLNVLTVKNYPLRVNDKPFTGGMTLRGIDRVEVDRSKKNILIYGQSGEAAILTITYGKGKLLVNGVDLPVKDEKITLGREKFQFPELKKEEKEEV